MERMASRWGSTARNSGLAILAMALVAGCTVQPTPLEPKLTEQKVQNDLSHLFADQEPLTAPLTLHEAMARAIKYNLDSRLQIMEHALQQRQLDVARYDMLPKITADAGYSGRNNQSASSSQNVSTGQESLAPSTSSERDRNTANLKTVWNVLDFGVSYVSAEQQADRTLIAYERRRKVIHNIIQDVRAAYWRAVAAERLLKRVDPLMERVERARRDSKRIEKLRLKSPIQALSYQRTLLETLQQLERQRRELLLAKTELAALINMPLDRELTIAMPEGVQDVPTVGLPLDEMEVLALSNRPELREARYQARIDAAETRKAMLRLLPGLEFNAGLSYDSNSFLVNNQWADYGARISWNLFSVFTGPTNISAAEATEKVTETRRMALNMAVLTQLYVAHANFVEAKRQFETADEMSQISERIVHQLRAEGRTQRVGDLAVIQGELDALQAALQRDLQYADLRNAFGQIFMSMGADPLPRAIGDDSIAAIATAIGQTEKGWGRGDIPAPISVTADGDLETASAK